MNSPPSNGPKVVTLLLLALSSCELAAQTWQLTSAPITNWTCVASSADGSKLVAGVNGGLLYISTNAGATWQPSHAPTGNWSGVCSSADGSILTASAFRVSYVSTNSGLTWDASDIGVPSLACSADGKKLFATGGNYLFTSADSGAHWQDLSLPGVPVGFAFLAIASSADGDRSFLTSLGQGNAYVGSYSNLWAGQEILAASGWFGQGVASAVVCSADGTKLACCVNGWPPAGGTLYTSIDGGSNWIVTTLQVTNITAIASSADGARLAAVAAPGGIFRSTNSGTNWSRMKAPILNWVSVASSADGNKMVSVVSGGGIYTYEATPTPALNIALSGSSLVLSWIIPSRNLILQQTTNLDATDWTEIATAPGTNYAKLEYQVTIPRPSATSFYRLGPKEL